MSYIQTKSEFTPDIERKFLEQKHLRHYDSSFPPNTAPINFAYDFSTSTPTTPTYVPPTNFPHNRFAYTYLDSTTINLLQTKNEKAILELFQTNGCDFDARDMYNNGILTILFNLEMFDLLHKLLLLYTPKFSKLTLDDFFIFITKRNHRIQLNDTFDTLQRFLSVMPPNYLSHPSSNDVLPIHHIVSTNNTDLLRMCLNNNAIATTIDFTSKNKTGQTILNQIIFQNDFQTTEIIVTHCNQNLEAEQCIKLYNEPDKTKNTPFLYACKNKAFNIVKLLLDTNQININHTNCDNKSALTILMENDTFDIFSYVLNNTSNIDYNAQDIFGNTLSMQALKQNKLNFVSFLESIPQVTYNQINNLGQSFISILITTKHKQSTSSFLSPLSSLSSLSSPSPSLLSPKPELNSNNYLTSFLSQYPNCFDALLNPFQERTPSLPQPNQYDIILSDVLTHNDVDISTSDKFKNSPLSLACKYYDITTFNALISYTTFTGPDPKCQLYLKREAEKLSQLLNCNNDDDDDEAYQSQGPSRPQESQESETDDWEGVAYNKNNTMNMVNSYSNRLSTIKPTYPTKSSILYDKMPYSNEQTIKKYEIVIYFMQSLSSKQ